LDDWERKIDSSAVETALSSLQMMISRPVALVNTYAVIAALDEVVNVGKDRATRFEIVLRHCHSLINNPALQQILIKLVASKEEAKEAKFIAKLSKRAHPREPRVRSWDGRGELHTPDVAIGALGHRRIENVGYVVIWTTFPVSVQRNA